LEVNPHAKVKEPMAQSFLLTDDEVVALAALLEQPWPTGLATVPETVDGMGQAAIRGIRALAVRGLLTGDPGAAEGYVIDPDLAAAVDGFLQAPRRVGAYLAPADAPDVLAGASITAAAIGDGWWLDATTAQGVHGFRRATRLEVIDALAELAEKTHDGTLLAGAERPSAYACVIRYGDEGDQKFVVPYSGVTGGPWDRTPLVEVFTAVGACTLPGSAAAPNEDRPVSTAQTMNDASATTMITTTTSTAR
jgi:hypothetical protein